MRRPITVKAWPELIAFLPSSPVFREPGVGSKKRKPDVEIDFTSVRAVSSTGLTIFLLRLIRLLSERKPRHIRCTCSHLTRSALEMRGALTVISSLLGSIQWELPLNAILPDSGQFLQEPFTKIPVYRITFQDHKERRHAVSGFVSWLSKELIAISKTHELETNGLAMLLNEIAKNSADHTQSDALFGIDVVRINRNSSQLTFSFGDLGLGIKQHIERNLRPEEEARRKHMSLYEAYRLALKPGYTSNRSALSRNKGHGMSLIIDYAACLNIHLSVFDAFSRGVLSSFESSQTPSHSAVRRIFHNVGHSVGFFYYGEQLLRRK